MIGLPATLATTIALALVFLGLTARVIAARAGTGVSLGGGDEALLAMGQEAGASALRVAIRGHANFAEFVPLCLILIGLLEAAGGRRGIVGALGAMLVLGRLLHPFGLSRPIPNPFRAGGVMLTLLVLVGGALYGLVLLLR